MIATPPATLVLTGRFGMPASDAIAVPSEETAAWLTIGGAVEFQDLWRDYRTHLLVDRDCAPSTVAEYGSVLGRWTRFLDSQVPPVAWDQAGREHLDRFLSRPAGSGRRKGQPLSVNRRRTDIVAICGLYRYAVLAGHLDRDPLALVRPPRRRGRRRIQQHRSFETPQLAAIFDAARDDPRLYLLVSLGYREGLRRAEMADLDLGDLARSPWPGTLHVVGKGGFERWVPLSAKTRKAMDRYLGDRANLTEGPLVANTMHPGRALKPGTIGDLLAALIQGCIDPADPEGRRYLDGSAHWLRHSAATNAAEARGGDNLFDLQEFLGHQDPRTTMSYTTRAKRNVRENVTDIMPDPEHDPEIQP